jgi:hypothetical protein
MKNSTKFKIIVWVEKILKYKYPTQIPSKKEEQQIQILQWEDSFNKVPTDIKCRNRIIAQSFAYQMQKMNIIQIKEKIVDGHKIVNAKAFFIYPPKK